MIIWVEIMEPAPQYTLNDPNSFTEMEFKLKDLKAGGFDPRGREVLDILWAVNEFKIYKTRSGISPFFCDDPEQARHQKMAYLKLGSGIAEFNHLIQILTRFRAWRSERPMPARKAENLVFYERELARCIAQALLGQEETAKTSLDGLRDRLASRLSNRGRVIHLFVNIVMVVLIIFGSFLLACLGAFSAFEFDSEEIRLALVMGSIGALFSTTVRLQSMKVDPGVVWYMHLVYAFQRVAVGALGALILYFGIKAGILQGLFSGSGASGQTEIIPAPYWLSFVCILAGFSERLVPNLLEAKSNEAISSQDETK
ncbi:hypothetical protein [Ruegeria arenilitoris]|uniref:hypothetical protein n=1 Tax=Ruegeria arenilitoris TaxID=1173585 RepID=UPI00147A07F4|nr:hypothetical protein [Ruegeria arenilitoris]